MLPTDILSHTTTQTESRPTSAANINPGSDQVMHKNDFFF
jgi:hypothetical protein